MLGLEAWLLSLQLSLEWLLWLLFACGATRGGDVWYRAACWTATSRACADVHTLEVFVSISMIIGGCNMEILHQHELGSCIRVSLELLETNGARFLGSHNSLAINFWEPTVAADYIAPAHCERKVILSNGPFEVLGETAAVEWPGRKIAI